MQGWQFFVLLAAVVLFGAAALWILMRLGRTASGQADDNRHENRLMELDGRIMELDCQLTELDRRLNERLDAISVSLERGLEQLRTGINESVSLRMDMFGKQHAERSDAMSDALSARLSAMSDSLSERSTSLSDALSERLSGMNGTVSEKLAVMNDAINEKFTSMGGMVAQQLTAMSDMLKIKHESIEKQLHDGMVGLKSDISEQTLRNEERFKTFETGHMDQLRTINSTMDVNLKSIRESNDSHLDRLRGIVDEKLQNTLNERITESFRLVNERLAEVYKGLGEMQSLAVGVGDLKKVLSNVKTRGILGEIQLGAILDEVLAPEQFVRNFDAGKQGNERVEFAIKLPNDGDKPVYLPIDSKFPADMYLHLTDAYDSGDASAIEAARKSLRDTLQKCARDVHDKYINPPRTTDFAVLFLPTEGLYAEAVRLGLVEILQRGYKVNIAGPSTMAALLNSLQMGFRTLAIQKRSSEVWDILAKIKKEFTTFDDVLSSTRKALDKANTDLDKLIGTRTRQILRTLRKVESLPADGVQTALPLFDAPDDGSEGGL